MKSSRNHSFAILISVLLVFILFSGCTKNQKKKENSEENTISISSIISGESTIDISDIISYCAKEKSEENRIYFNYPQFKETVTNADKLNQLIVEFVENALQIGDEEFKGNLIDSSENWKWDENDYTLIAMDISYKITRIDSDYFSVTFEGLFNHKFTPHPFKYFNSLIIDLKQCKLISLSDIYNIDTDFVKLIRDKFKEQIRPNYAEKIGDIPENIPERFEEILDDYSDISLLEYLSQSNKNYALAYPSFLTNTALGISVPLPYAIGGHIEITINYDELIKYLL